MSKLRALHGPNTRYEAINSSLFIENRKRLGRGLLPHSLVVVHSNDIMPMSGDGRMSFVQSSDLFYLSGIDQEETILVMYPLDDGYGTKLFIKDTTADIAIWEGAKYTDKEARECSGINEVYSLKDFSRVLGELIGGVEHVYLNSNEHMRAVVEVESRDARFGKWCRERYPLHDYKRLAPLMAKLRMVKSEEEVRLIERACGITKLGFEDLLPFVRPGMMEYELEAILIRRFIAEGSNGFGYEPIVASGERACVLHYVGNNHVCASGELILLDVGASYGPYKSDMTRVIPVDGHFTGRQRAVYEGVLEVVRGAKELLCVGNNLVSYHKEVGKLMEGVLVRLGLLSFEEIKRQDPKRPAYKRYFMHGCSHHLGLDTHDLALMEAPFEVGMVLTVEPGIYIPEEKMGIRLENDIVIGKNGVEDLMKNIPLEVEAIEEAMSKRS